ncbi:Translation factor pelota [Serendipita sp. 399]|nr:Translation factor pelota [Serendipita sp. 399]
MALDSYQLPVELWEEIISHALDRGLFPDPTATLFEKMDVFASPCKVYQTVRDRASLRLVCRLWDEIIRRKRKSVVFMDPDHEKDQICPGSSRRTEIISQWGRYCRRWPCTPVVVSRDGSCRSSLLSSFDFTDAEYSAQPHSLANIQVLRMQWVVEDQVPFLKKCINLEALWIPFNGEWNPDLEQVTPVLCKMQYLSHLYLAEVRNFGQTLKLQLPGLLYLGIDFRLFPHYGLPDFPRFPLDLEIPNVKTIEISGRIPELYKHSLEHLVNSCKESVVEIILWYGHRDHQSLFPLDQLCGFPRLTTLGLNVDRISPSTAAILAITPPAVPSPLSLVLLGLEKKIEQNKLKGCRETLSHLLASSGQSWFSKLIIGSEWAQLGDKWSEYCRDVDVMDDFEMEDALPCLWPVLVYLDQKGIPIEDRNGVGIREGDGASLAHTMNSHWEKIDTQLENAVARANALLDSNPPSSTMRLIGKYIDKNKAGYVTLRPEDDEDMWHLYNLIQEGDEVRAVALRRVQTVSNTGSTDSQRVRLHLTLQVTRTFFSAGSASTSTASGAAGSSASGSASSPTGTATGGGATMHITGRVTEENHYVKMGAFHTLDIEMNRDVKIIKEEWDRIALDRVDDACAEGRGAEVGAIVCGEGTAALCLLSEHMTTIRQRIDVPVPRKAAGSSSHDKGLERFYSTLYTAFLRVIPFSTLKVIVIASPGFVKDSVYDYIFAQAIKTSNKPLIQAKNKFIRVHVSSPHVHSLVEVLKSPEVTTQLKETKFAREGIMLDKFFKMLGQDEMRAWYGPEHVTLAADRGAIGTLLISDDLFRSSDPVKRKQYVEMADAVRSKGGEVLIFSSMHESGQQLNHLTGIAAILTFPLDIDMVEEEERQAKEEAELAAAEENG